MTEQEKSDLARRLADRSEVFDFHTALRVVEHDPANAEELLREKEESKKRMEDLAEAHRRLIVAARELR
jgi:hypothetical protein